MVGVVGRVDGEADDLAAVDVEDQVEKEPLSGDRSGQMGHVPAPDLARSRRLLRCRGLWRCRRGKRDRDGGTGDARAERGRSLIRWQCIGPRRPGPSASGDPAGGSFVRGPVEDRRELSSEDQQGGRFRQSLLLALQILSRRQLV